MGSVQIARRSVVVGLDTLAIGLAILSAVILRAGGIVIQAGWIHISLRTPVRTILWLGAVFVARLAIDRRTGPFGLSATQRDDDPLFPAAPAGLWRRTAIAAIGIGLALALLMHDQVGHLYSVPDLGDPVFSVWRIGWVTHQIAANPMHLFDANIFYPEPLTLTYSDPIILPAITVAPLLAIGVHPLVAYNLLLLSGFWFSGIAVYLLVERLAGSPRAAFIAGLTYACYGYRFEHYSHLELQMTQWMPLALLALHLFVSTGRPRYAVALALTGAAQLYSSMYYAVFFLVYAAVIAAVLLTFCRRPIRRLLGPMAIAVAIAAVVTVPLARAFIAAQPTKGERPIEEIKYYSAEPSDYLRANKYSWLWRNRLSPSLPERTLFPGAAPLALAAIGVVPPLGVFPLAYTAGLIVSFDGSLGFNGALYPYLHRWLIPFRGIRAPARFAAIVGLTLSILAGFGARRILARCGSRTRENVVFAALIAFVMIDAWPLLTLRAAWKEPPDIYAALQYTPGTVLAEFPMRDNEVDNIPFMYFSLWHWSRMVNGYSGFIPASYLELHKETLNFPDAHAVDVLQKKGVTHVTVNCGLNFEGCTELVDAMRHTPRLRLMANSRWMDRPVQLYEVLGP
jgi:hypothetical protein